MADNLDEAQEQKLDLICRKMQMEPGMEILDIGCGGFAEYTACKHGVRVTGITISEEQAGMARRRCAGLPVNIKLQDYRTMTGHFDRIVSIGMFEHVGLKNYAVFMQKVNELLHPEGLFCYILSAVKITHLSTHGSTATFFRMARSPLPGSSADLSKNTCFCSTGIASVMITT